MDCFELVSSASGLGDLSLLRPCMVSQQLVCANDDRRAALGNGANEEGASRFFVSRASLRQSARPCVSASLTCAYGGDRLSSDPGVESPRCVVLSLVCRLHNYMPRTEPSAHTKLAGRRTVSCSPDAYEQTRVLLLYVFAHFFLYSTLLEFSISNQARLPAEFKHINKRRKRN